MTRKLQRELQRQYPQATIETTGSGHLRLTLPNGKQVTTGNTPSDRRAIHNLRADLRRQLKETT